MFFELVNVDLSFLLDVCEIFVCFNVWNVKCFEEFDYDVRLEGFVNVKFFV